MYSHAAMIALGAGLIGWGLAASHRLKSPLNLLAALAVPAGVILFLSGTLLVTVPGFFQG